jgi:YegS/Rv2252/BmrU family lipid kinase
MKIRFIINPIAGTGGQIGIEETIARHLENYDIIYTQKVGDATKLSLEAVRDNIDAVVAVGGDGTLNECLIGLVNSNTALGIIPCGSGNGFAYHIGMARTTEKAIIQIKNAKIEKIDSCTANGEAFVNVSGIGFDAHIANLFAGLKKRGFINYVKLILKEISYKPQEYTLQYNGIDRKAKAYMISFANASQYGNDARVSPMADLKDGLLDFVIVKDFPKWEIPFFLLKAARGKIHLSKYVEIIKSRYMKISAKNTLLHLDGEPYKAEKYVEIQLFPKSLKILIPNG